MLLGPFYPSRERRGTAISRISPITQITLSTAGPGADQASPSLLGAASSFICIIFMAIKRTWPLVARPILLLTAMMSSHPIQWTRPQDKL